jgi:uncharacterized membrane protein YdjX (TVP38/TMEM64 family)
MQNAQHKAWDKVWYAVRQHTRKIMLGAAALLLAAVALWAWGEPLWRLLTDEQALEALVEQAGIWGPLALIAANVVQIVVAPVPGYVVSLSAGYLYGPLWGGIYAGCGVLLGGMAAMWVGRTFGRPFVRAMVGEQRLARWESVTHSDSPWVWFLLLLGPVGDLPFLLAGMSRVSYLTILLITLVIRVPSVFVSTAIGSGAIPAVWLVLLLAAAAVVMLVALRYRAPLAAWFERTVKAWARQRVAPAGKRSPGGGHAGDEESAHAVPTQPLLVPGPAALQPAPVESRADEPTGRHL